MYQYYYLLLYYFQAAATNQKLQQEFCSAVSFHHCFQVVTTKNYSKNPVLLLMSFSYYQKYSKTPLFLFRYSFKAITTKNYSKDPVLLFTSFKQLLPQTTARIVYCYFITVSHVPSSYYQKLQQESTNTTSCESGVVFGGWLCRGANFLELHM